MGSNWGLTEEKKRDKKIPRMAKKVGGIEYKRDFNAGLIRQMLGLDGAVPWDLPSWERERLATMLRRGHKITKREVRQLGGEIIRRENMEGI